MSSAFRVLVVVRAYFCVVLIVEICFHGALHQGSSVSISWRDTSWQILVLNCLVLLLFIYLFLVEQV